MAGRDVSVWYASVPRKTWIGVGLCLVLGFGGILIAARRSPHSVAALPVPLETLPLSWPGRPNPDRDSIQEMGAAAVPPLVDALQRRRWHDWKIWEKLALRFPQWIPSTVSQLRNVADQERRAALWMLGELGPDASNSLPVLRRFAADRSQVDQCALSVMALARIQPHQNAALSNALALLQSGQQTDRFYAAQVFGALTNHPGLDPSALVSALGDTDGEVRANMAFSIAAFGPRAAVAAPQLRTLLTDRYRHVSACAAYALVCIRPEHADEATREIVNALQRNADMVGIIAPDFFAVAGNRAAEAEPYLKSVLTAGTGPLGRNQAAVALWQCTGGRSPEAVAQLVKLEDPSPEILATVGSMGPAASNAIPGLRALATQPPPSQALYFKSRSRNAAEALRRIEGSNPEPVRGGASP